MSHIWTFSPTSEPLLQQCIEVALLQETNNEWIRHFGRKNFTSPAKPHTHSEKNTAEIIEIPSSPAEEQKAEVSVTNRDFFDNIDNLINVDFIVTECLNNSDLFLKMAQKLPVNNVEKLFNHVFASKDVDDRFLTHLFCKFLPQYIKLQFQNITDRLCIEILSKTYDKYPEIFKNLLKTLLEDIDVSNQILNNYVANLDEKQLEIFMENLLNIELSSESFVHNILTVYTAYKDCKKTEKIQNYVKTNLIQHSKCCTSNRNYGRIFLTYLQTEKLLEHKISKKLEDCLEMHHSPFRRPCIVLIKELVLNE